MSLSPTPAPGQPAPFEVVLVAYHSRRLVEELFDRLPAEVPVVVVDNARGVDGLAGLARARPSARYLGGPGRGFAAAANLAARTSTAEHLVFVNPDSSPRLEQLESLVADLRADPTLAAVSATTVVPDGSVEIGVGGWEPSVGRAIVHAVGAHKLFPRAGLWARPVPGRAIELDWLSGACMAVRRQQFVGLGCFDEAYFVYNEDVAFGRTIREAGLRMRVRTDLLVPHLGAGSGDGKLGMLRHRGASFVQYARQHHRLGGRLGMQLALTVGYLPRYLMCRMRGRHRQAREHAAYVGGLWFGRPQTGRPGDGRMARQDSPGGA